MDHSNQKECEGHDDVSGKLYLSMNLFVLLDTELLQHLFTRSHSLINSFKQM